eukprot:TRINITY_DN42584_c0_g1_i1.p1 TRINITY_DN42584_c0_g1~~TRINITY_DN42584_c0_g1_i1.p1  ORF type:complete len:305 (-),score=23.26 TRINITY_DN42584_c0_g1_i1:325-1239(-)
MPPISAESSESDDSQGESFPPLRVPEPARPGHAGTAHVQAALTPLGLLEQVRGEETVAEGVLKMACFTQLTIKDHMDMPKHQAGPQSFRKLLVELLQGKVDAARLPPIRLVYDVSTKKYWSLDDHRLYAFKLLDHLGRSLRPAIQPSGLLAEAPACRPTAASSILMVAARRDVTARNAVHQLGRFRYQVLDLADPSIAQEFQSKSKARSHSDFPSERFTIVESGHFGKFELPLWDPIVGVPESKVNLLLPGASVRRSPKQSYDAHSDYPFMACAPQAMRPKRRGGFEIAADLCHERRYLNRYSD